MKHKNIIFCTTILFSIISNAQKENLTYDSELFFNEGSELVNNSDFLKSIESFNKIHPLDGKYPQSQFELILSLLYSDKKEDALAMSEKHYEKKLYTDYPPLLIIHGILLSDNGRYAEAIDIFNEADKYFPNSSNLNYNKAIAYIRNKELQKAVDLLKDNIITDPSHTSSLFNLGILALEDGQLVEGNLLLMTYLLFEPNSAKSKQALAYLNYDYSKTYTNKPTLKIKDKGDDFALLEELLRNKYPYNSKFKLAINFNELAPRNIQAIASYFKDHEIKDGFFENYFGKLYKDISKNDLIKEYLYYTLQSVNELYKKEYSKNEKKITSFQKGYLTNNLWNALYNVALIEGEEYKVSINDNSKSFFQTKDGLADGFYFYTSLLGSPETKGTFKKNKLEGVKTSFYINGKLESEENYTNGVKNGPSVSYYPNGKIFFKANHKDDKISGSYIMNYPSGELNCMGTYNLDLYDGESKCFFSNGSPKIIANYKNGKYNGVYKNYNEVGEITTEANYLDDAIEGDYKTYYPGNKIRTVSITKNKIPITYKSYFQNGNIETEYIYENGKLKEIKNYYNNGKISLIKTLNNKEELAQIRYYNSEGVLFYEDNYTNGKAKQSIQYKADGSSEKLKTSGSISFNDLNGKKISEGFAKNGVTEGNWTYYYPNQKVRLKTNYIDGVENGERTVYLNNGLLDYIANIENDELNGIYKDFLNTKINFVSYYSNDQLNGPTTFYYYDGKIKSERFYVNGSQEGKVKYYNQDGSLAKETTFINDFLTDVTYYFGNQANKIDYINESGTIEVMSNNVTKRKINIKNAEKNGVLEISNIKNELITSENYVNNKLHGKATEYSPSGKVSADLNYHVGQLQGEQKYYDLNGKITSLSYFENGYQTGISKIFYPNGKDFIVTTFNEGAKNGSETYFNSEGKKILVLNYFDNSLISFERLNNGILSDTEDFSLDTTTIVSTYENGKPALEIHFKNGFMNGDFIVYNTSKQIDFQENYVNGKENGLEIWYLNGKKYKTTSYENGSKEGVNLYFNEQENVKYSLDFKNNEIHGYFKILENNTLKPIKKYDSDELAEIL